jgi:hypothetical protein
VNGPLAPGRRKKLRSRSQQNWQGKIITVWVNDQSVWHDIRCTDHMGYGTDVDVDVTGTVMPCAVCLVN